MLTKSIGRWAIGLVICLIFFAFSFLLLAEPVRRESWSDQYVRAYRRSSVLCYLMQNIFPHVSCGRRCISIDGEEWYSPDGGVKGYWRDPTDGAILFSTRVPGSLISNVYLVMPSGRPQFHVAVPYSDLIRFDGGDSGSSASEVLVTRIEKQKFELTWRDGTPGSVVIELSLYKK